MAQSYLQAPTDGSGKKIDTVTTTTAAQHRQVMSIGAKDVDANIAPVDATKGLAVDLSATGANSNKLLVTPDLPSGAATAAKQPALGTAGTASADVLTVQGIASGTPQLVGGDAASGATDSGNPVKVGGRFNTTAPTLTDGQRGDLQVNSRGMLQTTLMASGATSAAVSADNTDAAAVSATSNKLNVMSRSTVYNGTTWDRTPGTTNGAYNIIRDAAGNARGANITAGNALTVDGSASTQPVSGTVTANLGTAGTAATSVGKAEDAAHSSGDVGVMALGVRNDAAAVLSGTDLDYQPFSFDGAALRTSLSGFASTNNSSTATLTSGSVFTGTSDDALGYNEIRISVIASHASATDGLSIQQSSDNSNWDITDTYTVPAATGKTYQVPRQARYFRIVYTNGGTNQSSFRLATILNRQGTTASSQRTSDAYSNENDLEQIWSFNSVWNGTTWDRVKGDSTNGTYVQLKTIGSTAIDANAGAASAGTQRVVQANNAGKTIATTSSSAASSGNNTIQAAGTNKLKVFAFSLSTTSTTAVTCIFQSGAGGTELWRVTLQAISGGNVGANLAVTPPAYLFATASATLLNLNLSSANTVHYSFSYFDEA